MFQFLQKDNSFRKLNVLTIKINKVMSNNCLKTKLYNVVVDNQAIPTLGSFNIVIPSNGTKKNIERIEANGSELLNMQIVGGYFTDSNGNNLGTSIVAHAIGTQVSHEVKGVKGEGNVILNIKDDYNKIKFIDIRQPYPSNTFINLEPFYYRTNMSQIILYSANGVCSAKGDLSKFNQQSDFNVLSLQEHNDGDIIGEIDKIPYSNLYFIKKTSVSGTIENFLKRNRENIYATSSKQVIFQEGFPKNVTLRNEKISSTVTIELVNVESSVYTFSISYLSQTITGIYNASTDTWTFTENL